MSNNYKWVRISQISFAPGQANLTWAGSTMLDPEPDPQPQPPSPKTARRRSVAHVRPISIVDKVRDVSGPESPDPMRVVRDFDRVYMPKGGSCCKHCGCWSTRRGSPLWTWEQGREHHTFIQRGVCHAEIRQRLPRRSSKAPQDYHKRSTRSY